MENTQKVTGLKVIFAAQCRSSVQVHCVSLSHDAGAEVQQRLSQHIKISSALFPARHLHVNVHIYILAGLASAGLHIGLPHVA